MFDYSSTELVKIDEALEPKLAWAQTRFAEVEQLALDSTRLLSCTEDRLNDYQGQWFFKRCWYKLCGKHGEIQRANQNDLIEMQKYAWRYINLLQERDLLLAHSIITVKNNLMTLAVTNEETKKEITRMADRIYARFVALEDRVKDLEVTSKIHSWLLTLDTYDYDEKYPPQFRLLKIINDFLYLKEDSWNINELKYLQKAMKEVDLPWKKKIRLSDFINDLVDEIEDFSFTTYQKLLYITHNSNTIPESFILDNISVPSYTSLYQIADNYTGSSSTIDVLIEQLSLDKKEAIKKVLTTFVTKQGIDIEIYIPLRDLAVELLDCMRLSRTLFVNLDGKQESYEEKKKIIQPVKIDSEEGKVSEQEYTDDEKEYLELLEDCYEDGVITGDERRILDKMKSKYNISDEKASEMEESLKSKLDSDISDEDKDFNWYLNAAEQGNVEAQLEVANKYFDGEDFEKSFEWYKKASEQGNIKATEGLGAMYEVGLGIDCDLDKAFECYFKAAMAGIGSAQNSVGICYLNGISVNENHDEAFRWFQKSVDSGDAMGIYNVGCCYYNGLSVEKNIDKALKWLEKGVEKDNEDSMILLGTHYYHDKDLDLSKKYLQQAIEKGNATAMAIFAFITEVDSLSYDRLAGDLWIDGDNLKNADDKMKGVRTYAGDLVEVILILWDPTFWGSAKEGFIITDWTKDFTIVTHLDKPVSLLNNDAKIALHKMAYFTDKEPLVNAIIKLIELWKEYNQSEL